MEKKILTSYDAVKLEGQRVEERAQAESLLIKRPAAPYSVLRPLFTTYKNDKLMLMNDAVFFMQKENT